MEEEQATAIAEALGGEAWQSEHMVVIRDLDQLNSQEWTVV
jgi:hypothetical protein